MSKKLSNWKIAKIIFTILFISLILFCLFLYMGISGVVIIILIYSLPFALSLKLLKKLEKTFWGGKKYAKQRKNKQNKI